MPIVLATFPVIEGVDKADSFFNIVFFVVLTSTLIQGATFEPLARALGVTTDEPALSPPLLEVGSIRRLGAEVLEYPVADSDAIVGLNVNQLELPREALVSVLEREGEALLPRGSSEVEAGDRLHILVRQPVRDSVESLFDRWRSGPIGVREAEPPAPPPSGRSPIFTVKPWQEAMGDAAHPVAVEGVDVLTPAAPAARSPARWCCSPTAALRGDRRRGGGHRRRPPAVPLLPRAHRPRRVDARRGAWWQGGGGRAVAAVVKGPRLSSSAVQP